MVNCPAMSTDRQFSFPVRHEIFSTRGVKVEFFLLYLSFNFFENALSRHPELIFLPSMFSAQEERAFSRTTRSGEADFTSFHVFLFHFSRQMIPNLGRVASFDALSANMDKIIGSENTTCIAKYVLFQGQHRFAQEDIRVC